MQRLVRPAGLNRLCRTQISDRRPIVDPRPRLRPAPPDRHPTGLRGSLEPGARRRGASPPAGQRAKPDRATAAR
jgi:hypothetical protein